MEHRSATHNTSLSATALSDGATPKAQEAYDSKGNHLGSTDPITGQIYKPAVPGRTIQVDEIINQRSPPYLRRNGCLARR
ncbi:colicin E3/pyocin S6 family cytotoxin [Nocardia sp. NPDC049737]|uniref:colicin E3/pyocin S6 family cytotoxin n=1 Tax=Nocardia sp. NPDC049737 TaxID=3154358 RepID=UPI0034401CA1